MLLADLHTPVSIYLLLRDKYPGMLLLESSDYRGHENSFSFICCEPMAEFVIKDECIFTSVLKNEKAEKKIVSGSDVMYSLNEFMASFSFQQNEFPFANNGFFGYTAYNAVRYFEDIELNGKRSHERKIPEMLYRLFRYVLVFDHFSEQLHLFCHSATGQHENDLNTFASLLKRQTVNEYRFSTTSEVQSELTDDDYISKVKTAKGHCQRGDVFQVVLSREFNVQFSGDEFNVYRALRSVNPSPYLYYFDMGDFKLFGSSPEAQLKVKNGKAEIHPIAGTFRRTGHDAEDAALAQKLLVDEKENAEHVMLVDLARNDLSRACRGVQVEVFREVQYYSHVIHLVSKVTGTLKENVKTVQVVADTFPAGTLSGAPKYRAMQIIDELETTSREYYGGCVGFYGTDGSFNHAIIIRSFLSKNNSLYWRAGAGIVKASDESSELNEVNNKLAALLKALEYEWK